MPRPEEQATSEPLIYRVGDLDVDTVRGCITCYGREVPLKPKAFRLLVFLLQERHRLVSKEELTRLFWTDTAVTDDALTQCIARVRRALGDQSGHLKTVPRMGYRFVGPVEEVFSEGPALVPEPVASQEPVKELGRTSPRALWGRRLGQALALTFVAGSLGGAAYWRAAIRDTPPPARTGKRVIAMLAFENRSGQTELGWLKEGLPDMLATTLSRSETLYVLSREQVRASLPRGENAGTAAVAGLAQAAHVQAVVTGSFSRLGDSMRVDVRILDPKTGAVIVSDDMSVDRQDQILTQIDFLASRLAGRLGPRSSDAGRQTFGSLMTGNLAAYRYYSLGLDKAEAAQTLEAIALFEKALALDPGFGMAEARIGYAYAVAAPNLEQGRPYLERAFQKAAKLSDRDRRYVVAWYDISNRDYQSAIRHYTELLAEYPNDAEAHFRLAELLRGESRHEEALESLHRAQALNPEDPKIYNLFSHVSSEMGRHQDAITMAGRYCSLAPADANAYDSLGLAYYMAGQYRQSLAAYGKALALKPDFAIARLHRALLYAAMGRVKESVRESLHEDQDSAAQLTGCRARVQAAFALWRSGSTSQAKRLAPQSPSDCDPRFWTLVGAPTQVPSPGSLGKWTTGRGSRFGQRTGYLFQAELARVQGRLEERLANLRQLLRVRPGWSEVDIFEDALGDAYLELGRIDEAIHEYERALGLFPGMARARYHLAKAYRSKGLNELAKEQFREFLDLWKEADADVPELSEARRALQ